MRNLQDTVVTLFYLREEVHHIVNPLEASVLAIEDFVSCPESRKNRLAVAISRVKRSLASLIAVRSGESSPSGRRVSLANARNISTPEPATAYCPYDGDSPL
jgi:hypothetical protein